MLASRFPLVPNNDLFFANFAITLVGNGDGLSALVAMTAALTLPIHAVPIAAFGLYLLLRKSE